MLSKLKIIFNYIGNKILQASTFTFESVNSFCYQLYKTFILNVPNLVIGLQFLLIVIIYQAIVLTLNFEIFGKEFTFGEDLNSLVVSGFALIWNGLISFIKSFSPDSFLGLAFEIISEMIGLILFALGYLISWLLWLLKMTWLFIVKFGIYNIVIIISWLYLIGAIRLIVKNLSFINNIGRDEKNLIKNLFFSKNTKMLRKNDDIDDQENKE
tara:strand:- start:358 stop:993 length:636 start_codon:yes stop_codon:yes gene_type:complete